MNKMSIKNWSHIPYKLEWQKITQNDAHFWTRYEETNNADSRTMNWFYVKSDLSNSTCVSNFSRTIKPEEIILCSCMYKIKKAAAWFIFIRM